MPISTKSYKNLFCALCFAIATNAHAQITANQPYPKDFYPVDIHNVDIAVNAFMQKYHVPGLSFAIAKGDSLKLQRTYGYADSSRNELVKPESPFRIASISKSFTSAAVMLLMEQGKLKLSDKVFGDHSVLGNDYGSKPYHKWVTDITIANLLEHTTGGWDRKVDDPMMNYSISRRDLISLTLNTKPLTYKPGTHYDYSNFGYCLLGRVIEKITGTPYATFVKQNILDKCGITTMEIGSNTPATRKPNEVYYYDKTGWAYKADEQRIDSNGGWIASATDLVKFLVRLNDNPEKPELLKQRTLAIMYDADIPSSNYAKGWAVNSFDTHWHSGSMAGMQAAAVNTASGFSWAILVNTRADNENQYALDLDRLMWRVKDIIQKWPGIDLFEK
jgi:D-alanyl-D-alanine carboxypeptidase